ncbi:hypothetical protein [uncultured Rikenella sp.]|uniref:hypothetical protein n=1 Tax=uncultured Rikenella sp. TaxID=368003 RepID=UPI0025E60958|nr:hypothetical protein [uncultured Rikenella sp.]
MGQWWAVHVPSGAAPGYRYRISGALFYIGADGYSWSSTNRDTDGLHLGFGMTWLTPCRMYGNAHGFQLRCLSE